MKAIRIIMLAAVVASAAVPSRATAQPADMARRVEEQGLRRVGQMIRSEAPDTGPASPEPSLAHQRSRFAVVDPVYSTSTPVPAPDVKPDSAPWLYGEAELECWRLQVLRERMKAAKLKVGYPGAFHQAFPRVSFCCSILLDRPMPTSLTLQAVGNMVVKLGDRMVYQGPAAGEAHRIRLPNDAPAAAQSLRVDLETKGEPPAILIEEGPLATGVAPWQWSSDGVNWGASVAFSQTGSGVPPHRVEVPEVKLKPVGQVDGLYDFGRKVLGRASFRSQLQPSLFVGESTAEARNSDPRHFEQSLALRPDGEGRWISEHPLAFRHVRIAGAEAVDVECRALFHPVR